MKIFDIVSLKYAFRYSHLHASLFKLYSHLSYLLSLSFSASQFPRYFHYLQRFVTKSSSQACLSPSLQPLLRVLNLPFHHTGALITNNTLLVWRRGHNSRLFWWFGHNLSSLSPSLYFILTYHIFCDISMSLFIYRFPFMPFILPN